MNWVASRLTAGLSDVLFQNPRRLVDVSAERAANLGRYQLPLPEEHACIRDPKLGLEAITRNPDAITAFRKKYSSPETTVFVNVSPMADCDRLAQAYRAETAGLYDNTLRSLPIDYFNEGDVHLNEKGSRVVSEEVANQVLAHLKATPSATPSR